MGSKTLGLGVLAEVALLAPAALVGVVTLDDSTDGGGCLPDFQSSCQSRGTPLEVLATPSGLGPLIDRFRPDLVLVCGWYRKIPAEVVAKVAGGFIGLHASLLPRYRGFAPLVWTLLNGESEGGLSLFYLDAGLDTGDVVAQKRFGLSPDTTIAEALALAESHSLLALNETLPLLLAGRAQRTPQAHAQASYCSQRKPEDGRIDWRASGVSIHNAIRAQTRPYPGAFTAWGGRKLFLWKSARFSGDYFGIPGLTVESGEGEVVVACGRGAIRLLEIQLEGEAPRPASEVLKYGTRLG